MLFSGKALTVQMLDNGIAELNFDLQGESVNKFNRLTVSEFSQALDAIEAADGVKGVLLTSGKSVFIVGADITEFGDAFAAGPEGVAELMNKNNENISRLEELPVPSVVAINGYALGGGFEVCLGCDFRVMSDQAKVGLPEVKLGLIPGWGGTVRLPRLVGVDVAAEWIAAGKEQRPDAALTVHAVDAVVQADKLKESALKLLERAIGGELDYQSRREIKKSPIPLNDTEALMAFFTTKAFVGQQAGRNYPAPLAAVESIEQGYKLGRDEALKVEQQQFIKCAQTGAAKSLVGLFLNDQAISKVAKGWEKKADKQIERAAVLGAGIMGGGIAYQSAYKGVPIKMKDIDQKGIDLGLKEANKLLSKLVERGRMTPAKMGETLNRIEPTLSYDGFDNVDVVVEAVVENPKVKHAVLQEVEKVVSEDTVIASNTSTISIDFLAEPLSRPENFLGMHFFNPVHKMPLVEVIRGEKTSEKAIARVVAYANKMGKKAIVVRDCPGFLVNRVLFPYFAGFSMLVRDGADFQQIDKVMERWGWPMGPAYLMDVVGIDTGVHAEKVMAEGFPERMGKTFTAASDVMFEAGRYGQKNGKGFYNYEEDKKGKPKKVATEESYELLKPHVAERREFENDEIIERMMVPMATELARCLEEGIVDSPAEADMALIYGIGFPPFRGGIFAWLDSIGLDEFVKIADKYSDLGELYKPTERMREMAASGKTYYGDK
ncbi:fatty acid oxidation complex subunit alpha FadB [Microbulbifer thermotolerans]|uniref:enoyl-CoA hydratase n=1 Tax=Microbulbifer thermotolerans TaxID=252514 RepID=A0A143HM14_MICTH|nr:fatty acid oxidation complex subunit alpha FadB [Microbulbifer thermotolerans]AMX02739.1 multifunctional fatty acid oxidation complex subunit alpha [Microbulbifer thermotolerans]MCX2782559.1 fatty acid oxidation complex subunit alpha FadB [Microbulbifer thermotolerans]MCX2794571.1 fatty acid oxidation complex subunit alpha FadB [Microbulbifer thermotolerans]MCX2831660.1 fatty acid oxidation complex subunit alpha FadB [Microbulbifer thermotolerans]WKT59210.1 fatty acid oxidation complex subu